MFHKYVDIESNCYETAEELESGLVVDTKTGVNVRPHVHHPWSGHVHHLECV